MGSQTFWPPNQGPNQGRATAPAGEQKPPVRRWWIGAAVVGIALGVLIGALAAPSIALRISRSTTARATSAARAAATAVPTATSIPTPTPVPTPSLIPIAGGSWVAYQGGAARGGYAGGETVLNPQTVGNLKLKWKAHAQGTIFSQPVVVNGLAYWGSWDGLEHATDIASGHDVWTANLGVNVDSSCQPSSVGIASSAAVESTRIRGVPTLVAYVGGGDGRLYALDATTGAVIWRTRLGTPPATFLWSSPAVYNGSVYMGVSSFGDCPLIQGEVVRLDETTGAIQNVFKLVPNGCVGGSVWGSIAIDPTSGALFFATGNPASCGQAEPYAEAVVSLRASDLAPLGHWVVPLSQQIGDGDFGSTPTLFSANIAGQQRSLVGIPNKSGYFYAFDENHISAGPVWTAVIADAGHCPECGTNTITPGGWDGVTLYALGAAQVLSDGRHCTATVRALDPATGHAEWVYCLTTGPAMGALTVGPGFVIALAGGTMSVIGTSGSHAGKLLYSFTDQHDSHPWFSGPASISNGALYFGNSDGNMYALGL